MRGDVAGPWFAVLVAVPPDLFRRELAALRVALSPMKSILVDSKEDDKLDIIQICYPETLRPFVDDTLDPLEHELEREYTPKWKLRWKIELPEESTSAKPTLWMTWAKLEQLAEGKSSDWRLSGKHDDTWHKNVFSSRFLCEWLYLVVQHDLLSKDLVAYNGVRDKVVDQKKPGAPDVMNLAAKKYEQLREWCREVQRFLDRFEVQRDRSALEIHRGAQVQHLNTMTAEALKSCEEAFPKSEQELEEYYTRLFALKIVIVAAAGLAPLFVKLKLASLIVSPAAIIYVGYWLLGIFIVTKYHHVRSLPLRFVLKTQKYEKLHRWVPFHRILGYFTLSFLVATACAVVPLKWDDELYGPILPAPWLLDFLGLPR